jgi:hypothetical protein
MGQLGAVAHSAAWNASFFNLCIKWGGSIVYAA